MTLPDLQTATQLLYYDDPTQLSFTAVITQLSGDQVTLSATAFYPEGGGQNADTGKLTWNGGAAEVINTQKDKASQQIWHTLSGDLPSVGTLISGQVDAQRRWRTMQRHTAEHLLAQTFFRLNPKFAVVAVGMRNAECTIDLRGQPNEQQVRAAEALLQETLARRTLKLRNIEVPEAELGRYPMRRTTKISGSVRLVIFEDPASESAAEQYFDVSACGGVHLPWVAMALPVVILRTERIKGDLTRIIFMAGEEAAELLSRNYQATKALAATFSTGPDDLTARVEALRHTLQDQESQLAAAQTALIGFQVAAAPTEILETSAGQLRLRVLELADPALIPIALSATPDGEVLLITTTSGRVALGSASPVSANPISASEVLRAALQISGGKGGGKPAGAQGQTGDVAGWIAAVRAVLIGER